MRHHFIADAHPAISERLRRPAKVAYTLFEDHVSAIAYAESSAGKSFSLERARRGDISNVARSDEFLEKFENSEFYTPTKRWVDSVAGFVPNVPAYLAGHPGSMRRRVKVTGAHAPLVITADLSGSAGIGGKGMLSRSCAILALVRVLSTTRPVELWIGAHFGTVPPGVGHGGVFMRVPTTPLDLSVVTNLITDINLVKDLFLEIDRRDNYATGSWSYGLTAIERELQKELLLPAFANAGECLAIPAAHYDDMLSRSPEKWLREQISVYSPKEEFV